MLASLKANASITDVLARLSIDADGRALMAFLDEEIRLLDAQARVERDEVKLRWLQGAGQILGELREKFTNAQEIRNRR